MKARWREQIFNFKDRNWKDPDKSCHVTKTERKYVSKIRFKKYGDRNDAEITLENASLQATSFLSSLTQHFLNTKA